MGLFDKSKADKWARRGYHLAKSQQFDSAVLACERAIALDPDNTSIWNNKGFALEALGLYEDAVIAYDRAIALDPDKVFAWNNKAIALNALGRYEEAISAYDRALNLDPGKISAWNNKAIALNASGRYEEAVETYDHALDLDPNNADTWCKKGLSLNALGRHEDAILAYDRALDLDPNNADTWCKKGIALEGLGRYKYAIRACERAIAIELDNAEAWYIKGFSFDGLGRYEDAVIAYNSALAIDPDNAEAWYNKGFALDELGRYEDAIHAYDRAIALYPDDAAARYNKAVTLIKLGRYDDAQICCAKSITLDPDNSVAHELEGKISDYLLYTDPSEYSTSCATDDYQEKNAASLVIERTIFDPVTTGFLISSKRNLPNVQQWILTHDTSSYWYIICLKNTLSQPIDEWGISLDMGKAAGISDIVIENRDVYVAADEFFDRDKPWVKSYHFGFSRHDGVIIPRDSSLRIYIKIHSKTCNTELRIAGRFVAEGIKSIEIPEKRFTFACDVQNYKTALTTDPDNAKILTENVLKRSFDPNTARVLLRAFGHIHDINQCCSEKKYDVLLDKMRALDALFEKASAPERVHKMLSNNIAAVEMLEEGEETYERVERLWSSMLDVWQNEYIV